MPVRPSAWFLQSIRPGPVSCCPSWLLAAWQSSQAVWLYGPLVRAAVRLSHWRAQSAGIAQQLRVLPVLVATERLFRLPVTEAFAVRLLRAFRRELIGSTVGLPSHAEQRARIWPDH